MFETTNQLFTSKYKWARAVNPAIARKKSANCGSSQVPPVTRAMGILVAMTLSKYLGTWKKF